MRLNDVSYGSLTPEWTAEYQARVAAVVSALRAANKPTIWIGLPPMSKTEYGKTMIARSARSSGWRRSRAAPSSSISTSGSSTRRASTPRYGPDLNGKNVRMRKDDGIHFSTAGADKLAFYLSQTLKLFYRGGGRSASKSPTRCSAPTRS